MDTVSKMPWQMLNELDAIAKIQTGECYSNAGIAVLATTKPNPISKYYELMSPYKDSILYTIGILKTHEGQIFGHAWLTVLTPSGKLVWDSTLQKTNHLWNRHLSHFGYFPKKYYTAPELQQLFKEYYPSANYNPYGIPDGQCTFPQIDTEGNIGLPLTTRIIGLAKDTIIINDSDWFKPDAEIENDFYG